MFDRTKSIVLLSAACVLAACQSVVPKADHSRPDFSIGVKEAREVLELPITPQTRQLTLADREKIESFVAIYKDRGHGDFAIAMPSGGDNAQAAVQTASEARQIAYDMGVNWTSMSGTGYDATGRYDAPLKFSFVVYEAVPPTCPPLSSVDLSNMRSNDPTIAFGCTLQANIAAMIADPADLLGTRELDPGDNDRRQTVLGKYRAGQPTGATRSEDESGQVSDAVE